MEMTGNAELDFGNVRTQLLVALNEMDDPEYKLQQISQFSLDCESLGRAGTVKKWADYLDQLKVGQKYLTSAERRKGG